MIRVQIPNNNIPEREYIIKILLSDFLGLSYSIEICDSQMHYSIFFDECELTILDAFFGHFPLALSYPTPKALPENIIYAKNEFTIEKDIPVIYGTDDLMITNSKMFCGIDIFASSFFMLVRWEEYVNTTRDKHNRFPGSESIAYNKSFLHRPVVNEYVEMFWKMMLKLGYQGKRKLRSYELVSTCDVDLLSYPVSFRALFGDVLIRKNLKLAVEHFKYMFIKNPYDTFSFILDTAEKSGLKVHFYFMATGNKRLFDQPSYLKRNLFNTWIKEFKKRGHIIGFHPGYYTFDDPERWHDEKQLLEEAVQQEITEGRQHYLRFDITKTFRIWDKNKMSSDSTLGYADKEGFRCGTGDIFTVFDFLERKPLRIKELPLIIMDSTLKQYQQYHLEHVLSVIQYYISIGKKYKTFITILFHNTVFSMDWEGYDSIYKETLKLSE